MGRHVKQKQLILTFDAFGTLFSPSEPIARQYCDVAKQLGLSGLKESDVQLSFRNAYKEQTVRHPNYGKATGMQAREWWANVIRSTFTAVLPPCPSAQLPKALVPLLLSRFSSSAGYNLYPDVLPFFQFVRQQNFRTAKGLQGSGSSPEDPWPYDSTIVGVITNSDDRVPSILKSLGVTVATPHQPPRSSPCGKEDYFHSGSSETPSGQKEGEDEEAEADIAFVTLSYDVGVEKPGRGIFDAARTLGLRKLRERLPCPEGEVKAEVEVDMVHVGDDVEKDVKGARAAGWEGILLSRDVEGKGGEQEGGLSRIQDLCHLRDLKGWLGR